MKQILFLSFSILISRIAISQVVVNIPVHAPFDSVYTVSYGVTDSFNVKPYWNKFYVCDNATLIFKGNFSSSMPTFYLEPSATLILKDPYFYPKIYMRVGSFLNAEGGNQNIQLHRESVAYLLDTANVNFAYDSVHSSINFTYTNWPNATKPCGVPNAVSPVDKENYKITVFQNNIHYIFETNADVSLHIFDTYGRVIKKYAQLQSQGIVALDALPQGIYILKFNRLGKTIIKKIQIQ